MHPQLDNRIRARLRLRHLELLDALGVTLNLHKAAPRLNLSQPATSKLLAELEALYRTKLFDRLARGLRPTDAGEVAIRWARQLLHEMGDCLIETHLVASGASGRVRLGAVSAAIPTLFQRVLADAHTAMPQLVVHVVEGSLEALLAALQRKELDLVLARLTQETQHPSLHAEALYAESVDLVASPGHPLLKKRRLRPQDLAGQEWVLPPAPAPMRQALERTFQTLGLPRANAWIETNSLLMIETALSQAQLIAAMPHSVARMYQARGHVRILKVDLAITLPPVGMVTLASDARGPSLERLLDLVRRAGSHLDAHGAH